MKRSRLLAFATLFVASVALAQARLPERRVGIAFPSGEMHVTFSARDLADENVQRSLASGLQKNFAITIQAYPRGSSTPFASRQLTCRVTYDLWEEEYVVRRGRHPEIVRTAAEAISRCLVVSNVGVADVPTITNLHGREIFVAIRAEFNPIAGSACARSLQRPGGDDPLGPVVVNIVRREICQAERALEFRSPYVRVP